MTEEQLTALLRLKRHEQPPEGYFDRLLENVHRRQRAELLRQPLWKIAVERVHVFFSEHSMGHLTYAGSMATLLVAGVAAIRFMTAEPGATGRSPALAKAPQAEHAGEARLELQVPPPLAWETRSFPAAHAEPAPDISEPRYIMDARPVSHEVTRNYNF